MFDTSLSKTETINFLDSLYKVGRENLWNQALLADLKNEVEPFRDLDLFRSTSKAYDGRNTFWQTPSPEPSFPSEFWQILKPTLHNKKLEIAGAQLATAISKFEPDGNKIIFAAILRAGVPLVDWLTRLFPNSLGVQISLFVGFGIDQVAIKRLQEIFPTRKIIFVDGWTGKGGVAREIIINELGTLAVLIDPWGWANFAGCQEDLFCPTACFTGPTTLGFSRTFFTSKNTISSAYLFPVKYQMPDLIKFWQEACPRTMSKAISVKRFFRKTNLRLHSNEVCRALINADPKIMYFTQSKISALENFETLLRLAEIKSIKVEFNANWLKEYQTNVACSLENF
jgi:Phosphoribosyl transferase (PRTase)